MPPQNQPLQPLCLQGSSHNHTRVHVNQNTPAGFIVRGLICSDGSESLILMGHNHADPLSNGCLIYASESSISSYLVLSSSPAQKKEEKDALLVFYNHTAEAKLQAIM